jgi:hypothetical protein
MMGYYDNLPSFKPAVDPRSFSGGRMSPEDRATMNMRMDRAIPDAQPAQPAMPMQVLTGVRADAAMPTRAPAISSSFPVLNSRDTPPPLPAQKPDQFYGQPPAVMQPVDATPSAASRYAGDIASKTFLPYVQSAITNAGEGNYLRSVGNVAGAVKQAVVNAPSTVASDIGSAISGGYNEFKQGAGMGNTSFKTAFAPYSAQKQATPSPAPAGETPAPVQTPGGPKTVTPAAPQQRLSELYPSYFKSPPKFADALNGGGGSNPYKLPLTAAEQNYNAQILRSMELENRARELSNVDRYRATQLHDPASIAALAATRGGAGGGNYPLARQEYDPRYIHYPKDSNTAEDKADMISQREGEIQQALFDPTPGIPDDVKIANVRRKYPDLLAAYAATGKQSPYDGVEDYISKLTGRTYNGRYFTSGQ